jgi:transcriptional regulator with XRE-family HTH domain
MQTPEYGDIGERVMRLRVEKRLSRAALFRRCPSERPLSATAIERIEHSEHRPRLRSLEALAIALGASMTELTGLPEEAFFAGAGARQT